MHKRYLTICLSLVLWLGAGSGQIFAQSAVQKEKPFLRGAFVRVAQKVGPAVVTVSRLSLGDGAIRLYDSAGRRDRQLERYYLNRRAAELEKQLVKSGIGSGVIIDPEGFVLTNRHVVQNAHSIEVTLSDGRRFSGEVIGIDTMTDLAVIKIDAKELPFVRFADSSNLQIGQFVAAVGNPFGFMVKNPQPSITVGVISALGRELADSSGAEGEAFYTDLIQTDAALNQGNSGGPLVNMDGDVIGINTLIFSPTGGSIGLGFALPSNRVSTVVAALKKGEKISYGWLGVQLQELNAQLSGIFGSDTGLLVSDVLSGGPAQKAGLLRGDVIFGFKGEEPAQSLSSFFARVCAKKPGSREIMTVIRNKKKIEIEVLVGHRIKVKEDKQPEQPEIFFWRGAEFSSAKSGGAVLVLNTVAYSAAARAGLCAGDRVDSINRKSISGLDEFSRLLSSSRGTVLLHTDNGFVAVSNEGR